MPKIMRNRRQVMLVGTGVAVAFKLGTLGRAAAADFNNVFVVSSSHKPADNESADIGADSGPHK